MDNPNCADGKTPDYNSETYQAEVGDLRNQYEVILAKALAENPVKPPTGKRGITKQSKATNLIFRLLDDSDDVWRFMTQVGVPFTNNLAEQAVRMPKVKPKVSGCFRTHEGSKTYCVIRSIVRPCTNKEPISLSLLSLPLRALRLSPALAEFCPSAQGGAE